MSFATVVFLDAYRKHPPFRAMLPDPAAAHGLDYVVSPDQNSGLGIRVSCRTCKQVAPYNHETDMEAKDLFVAHLAGAW